MPTIRKPAIICAFATLAAVLVVGVAHACTLPRTECEYVCIEYYPNGTDCRKTKKHCYTVCDDFDVDRGGVDDANRRTRP